MLWVLVRTASARWFKRVPTIYVLSKNKKNIKFFQRKTLNFQSSKNLYIAWASFRNDVMDIHKNHLAVTILMSTHNICIHVELTKKNHEILLVICMSPMLYLTP